MTRLPCDKGGTCPTCNAPEPEETCTDCHADLDFEDAYEDAKGNPICGKCNDKGGPIMPAPPYTCRRCGEEYEPDTEGQRYCSEGCESTDQKIDEAERRAEEKRDA